MYSRSYILDAIIHYAMHKQRGPKLYAFITSALDGDDRSTSCSDRPFPADFPRYQTVYGSVSQPPGRGPVPGPGINYTGPREA